MELNVVSVNVPQVGCQVEKKEEYWSELDGSKCPQGREEGIRADFNGYAGKGNRGEEEVLGRYGVKQINAEGQMMVDFVKRIEMAVVDTY